LRSSLNADRIGQWDVRNVPLRQRIEKEVRADSPRVFEHSGGRMSTWEQAEFSAHLTEKEQETRNIRRLQIMMSMVMSVISQDRDLTVEEASELAAGAKRAALAMFPDKELAYDILYKPRLQRLMNERFRLQ
jgi:hypothetical protein